MRRLVGSEEELALQLARYMRLAHSNVLWHFDYGSGLKMTMGQAIRQKQLNERAWPDLFIAAPTYVEWDNGTQVRSGLFIELKREGTRLRKKNGEWASDHIAEQAAVLEQLRQQGYAAAFCVGLREAVETIDNYLGKVGDEQF